MLKQPEETRDAVNLYRALTWLKQSENGKTILKFLESEKRRLQDKNDNEDDITAIRRTQGASKLISMFLKMTKTSQEEANKLLNQK